MKIVVGVAAAALVAWAAVPWVCMARRGTVDEQTVAAWRAECVVPRPRPAPDDVEVSTAAR